MKIKTLLELEALASQAAIVVELHVTKPVGAGTEEMARRSKVIQDFITALTPPIALELIRSGLENHVMHDALAAIADHDPGTKPTPSQTFAVETLKNVQKIRTGPIGSGG